MAAWQAGVHAHLAKLQDQARGELISPLDPVDQDLFYKLDLLVGSVIWPAEGEGEGISQFE